MDIRREITLLSYEANNPIFRFGLICAVSGIAIGIVSYTKHKLYKEY